eukprot:TRINITY_DN40586_c0_g1_i1.p1 TRINITY_DN40586_c0_g1~~TRINITY_DN40586_c0_g1_i1.p1  ORF type:complete len:191 (+),score=23.50 TRINITY_DN40586_c0_g1_i1:29-574(+)
MKTNRTILNAILGLSLFSITIASCKKDSTTSDDIRREQDNIERDRKESILKKLSGKTYTLVVIKNATTGENLMASSMFPVYFADDTFTLSDDIMIDFDYSTARAVSTSRNYKGTYTFKSKESDSVKFAGMDEAPAFKLKGINKQDVYAIKTFDDTSKTLILSFRLANGDEITRQYSFKNSQ